MTKFLFGCDARLTCVSAIAALLTMRMELDRRVFACAVKRAGGGIVIYSFVAELSELIRWSQAG